MNNKDILSKVDHTLLKPTATIEQINVLCEEALQHGTASVCIPSSYVKEVSDKFGEKLTVCTVIGFPLGYSTTASKVAEAVEAVENGATEVDMVINVTDMKNKRFNLVLNEIKAIKEAIGSILLKVIVETCYLDEDEKIKVCELVSKSGAEYIKTSTGFGSAGADLADIALFKKHLVPNVKIKASGGIRTKEEIKSFINAGCDRIGASSAIEALN